MKFEDYLEENAAKRLSNRTVVGIDIGSRQAKAVLLKNGHLYCALIPTGFVMKETADQLLEILYREGDIRRKDIEYIVVTGYGRVSLKFEDIPYRPVTEISCHGKGAHYIGKDVRTIIDIGGQDSKVIKIDPEDGKVLDFAMNDKCAAGTGRFLERIANVLGYDVTEIGDASLKAEAPVSIDSTCVVFAESEVVSSRAKGESPENLAAGIHNSVAKRVSGLLSKVGIESNVLFTGGVSNNRGMRKAFEDLLRIKIVDSRLNTVYAGALGAATFAAEYAQQSIPTAGTETDLPDFRLDMTSYYRALETARDEYVNKSAGKKANVAYTCNYTPMEILAAANVSYLRLLHKGTPEEVIAGETLTQSMMCDWNKSIVGGFIKKRPEQQAIDKLYSFFSCRCMKNTIEAINEYYVPTAIYNVPRKRHSDTAKEFLVSEILAFKQDLEELTKETISEDRIREKTIEYNKAKAYIRDIAEYRKKGVPLISSSEFQDIIKGYYTIPVDKLLIELQKLKVQLKTAKPSTGNKLRLMLTGGSVADGDDKITRIIEQELGEIIVVEDNCTGIKPLNIDVETDADGNIIEQLSEAYLGQAPCARMYNTEEMIKNSMKLAEEYAVDGIILYYLKFCPCYGMVEKLYSDVCQEKNIPLIIISGDYSEGDEGQVKTRLEAFTEMIWERKGI